MNQIAPPQDVNMLWTEEKLIKILRKKKHQPEIVGWTLDRLDQLSPETAVKEATEYMKAKDKAIAEKAARFFIDHGKQPDLETFKQFYLKSDGQTAGDFSDLLIIRDAAEFGPLFREKYPDHSRNKEIEYLHGLTSMALSHNTSTRPLIEEAIETFLQDLESDKDITEEQKAVFLSLLLVSDTSEIDTLKRFLSNPNYSGNLGQVIELAASVCGITFECWAKDDDFDPKILKKGPHGHQHKCSCHDNDEHCHDEHECGHDDCGCQEDDTAMSIIGPACESLMEYGYAEQADDWNEAFDNDDFQSIVSGVLRELRLILEQKNAEYGREAFDRWKQSFGNLVTWTNVIENLGNTWELVTDRFKPEWAAVMLEIFEQLVKVRQLIGKPLEQFDTSILVESFLHNRQDIAIDPLIRDILKKVPEQEKILDACMKELEGFLGSSSAERALVYMASEGNPEHIRRIIELIEDKDNLWNAMLRNMQMDPVEQLELARELLANKSDETHLTYGLLLLENLPFREAADIILDDFEEFWCFDKEIIIGCIEKHGDQRYIRHLKHEWREGEINEGKLLQFLCQIHGVKDSLLKKIETDIKHWDKFFRRNSRLVEEKNIKALNKMPLPLTAYCLSCNREYTYIVHEIHFISEPFEVLVRDRITCKNCGVIDNVDISPQFNETVNRYLTNLLMLRQALNETPDDNDFEEATVKMAPGLKLDGKPASTFDMICHYQDKSEEEPGNAKNYFELGTLLQIRKKSDMAVKCLQKCIEIEPVAVSAYIALAIFAIESGDFHDAYEYYSEVYNIMDVGVYYGDEVTPENVREIVAPGFVEAATQTRNKVPQDMIDIFTQVMDSYRDRGY